MGLGWHSALASTTAQLESQKQEAQKYVKLAQDYSAQLDQKSLELDSTNAELATAQQDLKTAQNQYVDASIKLSQDESQLSKLQGVQDKLKLYQDTYGTFVGAAEPMVFRSVNQNGTAGPTTTFSPPANQNTVNPTWAQLVSFLASDNTDKRPYVYPSYECGNFAYDVMVDAADAGIRAAWVRLRFSDKTVGHVCNAFMTTDKGLIFVDCTGLLAGRPRPSNCDRTVDVELGKEYIPVMIFPEAGWRTVWGDVGTVSDVQVYWQSDPGP